MKGSDLGIVNSLINKKVKDTDVGNLANEIKDVQSQLDENKNELTNKINEVATNGTTVEVVTNTTKTQIDKYIKDGTIANMTIANDSIDYDKLKKNSIKDYHITGEIEPSKISFITKSSNNSLNLINFNKIKKDGKFNYITGAWESDTQMDTFIIKCEPNTEYSYQYYPSYTETPPIIYFDRNFKFIKSVINSKVFTTPTNCEYFALHCGKQYQNRFMLFCGNVAQLSEYVPPTIESYVIPNDAFKVQLDKQGVLNENLAIDSVEHYNINSVNGKSLLNTTIIKNDTKNILVIKNPNNNKILGDFYFTNGNVLDHSMAMTTFTNIDCENLNTIWIGCPFDTGAVFRFVFFDIYGNILKVVGDDTRFPTVRKHGQSIAVPLGAVKFHTSIHTHLILKVSLVTSKEYINIYHEPVDEKIVLNKDFFKSEGISIDGAKEIVSCKQASLQQTIYKDVVSMPFRDNLSGTSYIITHFSNDNLEGGKNILKLGFSGDTFNDGKGCTPTQFSQKKNTMLTINAGVFNTTTITSEGIFIINGVIMQDTFFKGHYTLGIKMDNTLVAYNQSYNAQAILNDGCNYAVTGFIPIIQNSELVSDEILSLCEHAFVKHPRQVIGQLPNKEIFILTCDGRLIDEAGMTLKECARILLDLGCSFAYNLDGGGSNGTVVKRKLVSKKIDNNGTSERAVPNFLYIENSLL